MADRDKVIRGLEVCIEADFTEGKNPCTPCPYFFDGMCHHMIMKDTLELLKEQEPTTYAYDEYMTPACQSCGFKPFIMYIPTLERMQLVGYSYCPKCGRRIKWEVSGDAAD